MTTQAGDGHTDRERQLIVMVGHGLSNEEIATTLHLSLATVRTHIGRAMRKFDARTRTELVGLGYEPGLVRPSWLNPGRWPTCPAERSARPFR